MCLVVLGFSGTRVYAPGSDQIPDLQNLRVYGTCPHLPVKDHNRLDGRTPISCSPEEFKEEFNYFKDKCKAAIEEVLNCLSESWSSCKERYNDFGDRVRVTCNPCLERIAEPCEHAKSELKNLPARLMAASLMQVAYSSHPR